LDRAEPRGTRDHCDVAGEQSAVDGLVERAAHDEVDLVDRLGRESGPLDGRGDEPVVERFDVVVAESS
jgi:hypothetical protein